MSNHPNLTYRWNTGSFSAFINNLSAGTYTVTVTDVDGCQDTAITEINNSTGFDTGIVINENKLVANQNDVSYQWIDCENNTYLQGAVYQSFNPSRDGNYSVELKGIDINGNECVEITDCVNFELSSSTEEKMFWNKVKIPTIIHDELNIQLSTLSLVSKIYIKNMSGYSMTIDAKNVVNNISIDLVTLPSGMYFIVFEINGERFVKKIIKI
ncbi:MAG: T9SS type A sorting domain-containing protein [Saprospiraceae bacterium]|nr:T9SS type A sorting domain-containing protein [Saprospiraceae bacterium]